MSDLRLPPEFWSTVDIEPEKTLVVAYVYGGFAKTGERRVLPLFRSTGKWIAANFPEENFLAINKGPYLVARNSAIRDLIIGNKVTNGRTFDWFLSIDNDVTITTPGMENFLKVQADVVSCDCRMRNPHAWDKPQSFHTPMWFCRTEVLRATQPPWFNYNYSPDFCELLSCDCTYFRNKVIEAGFSVAHGGHCGHGNYGSTWWSNTHGEPELRMPNLGTLLTMA